MHRKQWSNCQHLLDHRKSKRVQQKYLLYWLRQAFDNVDHNKLGEILQEMGIPDHLTCLLRNLYACQEAIVRTGHGTTDWFQDGKGVCQGRILSPCLFNLYAEYIMWNAGLDEAQARIKPQICRWQHPYGTQWRRPKEHLDERERGEWKSWLNIQNTKIIASRPITSWQIDGETMETVTDFIFGAPKSLQMVTAAMKLKDACSLEEKLWPT